MGTRVIHASTSSQEMTLLNEAGLVDVASGPKIAPSPNNNKQMVSRKGRQAEVWLKILQTGSHELTSGFTNSTHFNCGEGEETGWQGSLHGR